LVIAAIKPQLQISIIREVEMNRQLTRFVLIALLSSFSLSLMPYSISAYSQKEESSKRMALNDAMHGDWAGDIAAYDAVNLQILHMADGLSEGIIKQFPNKVD